MATQAGDIQINAKDYLLRYAGYDVFESFKSAPRSGGATDQEFNRADNWIYWGQSDYIGQGEDEWLGEGPFSSGYGLDLQTPGQFNVAKQLEQTKADAANTGGYICFADGTTRLWFIGKTNGTAYHTTDGSNWTTVANALGAGVNPTSAAYFEGAWYVASDTGKLFKLSGTTFTQKASRTGPIYILGVYKGKLYVGSNKGVDTYAVGASAFTTLFASDLIEGTPIIGTPGGSYLFFMTSGPNPTLLLTDSNQLHQLSSLDNDFTPKAISFAERLVIAGNRTDETNTKGQFFVLTSDGLLEMFEFGDETADYGVRSMIYDRGILIWGANQKTGLGIYDPTLDLYEDTQMGFYVSSVITSVAGVVHGIVQFKNIYYCGIEAQGIYKQTTPGTFKIVSSRFDFGTRNINKLWGFGELHHSALTTGQSISLATTKDGTTETSWGTSNTVGDTSKTIGAPASYKSPYLQYVVSGDANGAALSIFDISLAFIEASDNPKKEWDLIIVLEGGPDSVVGYQEMRDGSRNDRSAVQMVAELNALWNTKTTFEDIDGTTHNIIFKAPRARMEDIIKDQSVGDVTDLVVFYRVRLVEL